MHKKGILASLFIVLTLITGCKSKENKDDISGNIQSQEEIKSSLEENEVTFYEYFDTVTTFTAYTKNEDEFKNYEKKVESLMKKYDELFNSYKEFKDVNNIYTINKEAGVSKVKVDSQVIDLINEGFKWYEETSGDINIAEGSVLKIWTDFRDKANENPKDAKLPEMADLKDVGNHTDINEVEVDNENSTVFIKDKNVQLDLGAIGKGYATELIKEELIKDGLENAILSVGGDVAIIGDNPTKKNKDFNIAIQNPDLSDDDPYSSVVAVKNTSVVTSGDYQRYFEIDGRKYHHIIDPKTLMPSTNFKSVTVILDDIGDADALSTALFIKDLEEGKKLAKKYNAEAFWIDCNGKEYKTDGYKKLEVE